MRLHLETKAHALELICIPIRGGQHIVSPLKKKQFKVDNMSFGIVDDASLAYQFLAT